MFIASVASRVRMYNEANRLGWGEVISPESREATRKEGAPADDCGIRVKMG